MDDYLAELTIFHEKELRNRNISKELLETMSYKEAKELLISLLQSRIEKKKALEQYYRKIKRVIKKYHAPGTIEYNFSIDSFWLLYGANDDLENQKQLDRLERNYIWNESRKPKSTFQPHYSRQNNSALIQLAKQTPIENFYKNPLRRSGRNRLIGLCIFHQERRGSFTIFTTSNMFYCFGCHEHGDSITFYQKLYGLSFWEAVKQLTGSY